MLSGTEQVITDLKDGVIPFSGQMIRNAVKELHCRRRQMVSA